MATKKNTVRKSPNSTPEQPRGTGGKAPQRTSADDDGFVDLGSMPNTMPNMMTPHVQSDEERVDRALRPTSLNDYVGQKQHIENLRIFVEAARRRGDPLDHVLLCGPPGLGKTTLAHILSNEMGVELHTTSGPAIEHKGALATLLTKTNPRDVVFIDEIHRLQAVVEENLYPAMEDYKIDLQTGEGAYATSIVLPISPFTCVGATTRTGLLTGPLVSRFGHIIRLDFYEEEELALIVKRSASILGVPIDEEGAQIIASRARGTPRIANRLLRNVRDFALVLGNGAIDEAIARKTCERLRIDALGLDMMDRRLLQTIVDVYDGGPVGIDALAASLAEPRDTLEDVIEPFLLQKGLLARTPRGRSLTRRGYEHLGLKSPIERTVRDDDDDEQGALNLV